MSLPTRKQIHGWRRLSTGYLPMIKSAPTLLFIVTQVALARHAPTHPRTHPRPHAHTGALRLTLFRRRADTDHVELCPRAQPDGPPVLQCELAQHSRCSIIHPARCAQRASGAWLLFCDHHAFMRHGKRGATTVACAADHEMGRRHHGWDVGARLPGRDSDLAGRLLHAPITVSGGGCCCCCCGCLCRRVRVGVAHSWS